MPGGATRLLLTVCLMVFLLAPPAWGQLRLLTEISPPAQMMRNGQLTGRTVELVREAMSRMGLELSIKVLPWARAYSMALQGPMVGLFATTRTEEREDMFKWAGPLTRLKWVFYARKDSGLVINTLEDARKVERIGTYRHDAREQFLQRHGFTNLESVNDQKTNLLKLALGRLDLVAGTNLGTLGIARQAEIDPSQFESVFTFKTMDLYLAFSKDVPDKEVALWNRAFESMHNDGAFREIYFRWQPDSALPPRPSQVPGMLLR